ncbi:TadE family protein [Streptomyces sp. NPDC059740]|uniref:TadE family protein n=1 Tax=Streptomyces sp. NPDC059740 TaxID=3346926 RepID=UPI003656DCE4
MSRRQPLAAPHRTRHRPRPLWPGRGRPVRPARDLGQASLEFLGFLPVLLAVGLAVVQLGLAAYAVQQAGTGARAAARAATLDRPAAPAAAGRDAMTGWVADRATVTGVPCAPGAGSCTATVTVAIPSLLPGFSDLGHATRSATMPMPPHHTTFPP